MAIDDSKILYTSNWDIDQLTRATTTVVFTAKVGNEGLHTFPAANIPGGIPVFDGVWRENGVGPWKQFGKELFLYASASGLTIYNPYGPAINISVRYYTYADKLDY